MALLFLFFTNGYPAVSCKILRLIAQVGCGVDHPLRSRNERRVVPRGTSLLNDRKEQQP